jgi:hypothetical protein
MQANSWNCQGKHIWALILWGKLNRKPTIKKNLFCSKYKGKKWIQPYKKEQVFSSLSLHKWEKWDSEMVQNHTYKIISQNLRESKVQGSNLLDYLVPKRTYVQVPHLLPWQIGWGTSPSEAVFPVSCIPSPGHKEVARSREDGVGGSQQRLCIVFSLGGRLGPSHSFLKSWWTWEEAATWIRAIVTSRQSWILSKSAFSV